MTPAEAARYIPRVRTLLARDGYSEQEIQDALQAVPATMDTMPISRKTGKPTADKQGAERLYERCTAFLNRLRYEALPRRNGYTAAERREIGQAIRKDCEARLAAFRRQAIAEHEWAVELAAAYSWIELEETILAQQRVIDSLLAYIANLPLPETVLTMDRRAA